MASRRIIAVLRAREPEIRAHGVTALHVFGSAASGRMGPRSDVDLFIDRNPRRRFSLVDLLRLKHFLEGLLGRSVDLTTRDGLHRLLRRKIESEAVRVF